MAKINNNRVHPDGTGPRPDLSKIKREEAIERQDQYDKLSVEQKISTLDSKLGVGQGAKHQRAKLTALLEKKNTPATNEVIMMAKEAGSDMMGLVDDGEKKHLKAKERRRQERKD